MGIAYDRVYAVDGQTLNIADRVFLGTVTATYGATSGTATGTVAVTWTEPVPTPYAVVMSPVEQCMWWVTSRTTLGFTLNVAGTASLTGGTVELLIVS